MGKEKIAVALAVQAKVPVILWGDPGTGKTSFIISLGEQLGIPVETVIASIREPSDFSGLPIIVNGEAKMAPPAWAKRLAEAGEGLLFLDEISTAPPAVQAALLRVVLDRVVGDLKLPDGIAVVAAANPPQQAAYGWDLTPALANRFCHIDWKPNASEWVEDFVIDFKKEKENIPLLPKDWKKGLAKTKNLIAAFIHARPQLLHQLPKEESYAGRGWASRRSWEMTAYLMTASDAAGADEDVKIILTAGCIGEGTAIEFLAWVKDLDLPNPEDLLKNPASFKLPTRGDKAYAVLAGVAQAVVEKPTKERWLAAWEILGEAAKQGGRDIAAGAIRILITARQKDFPLPTKQIQEFVTLLKTAGLI